MMTWDCLWHFNYHYLFFSTLYLINFRIFFKLINTVGANKWKDIWKLHYIQKIETYDYINCKKQNITGMIKLKHKMTISTGKLCKEVNASIWICYNLCKNFELCTILLNYFHILYLCHQQFIKYCKEKNKTRKITSGIVFVYEVIILENMSKTMVDTNIRNYAIRMLWIIWKTADPQTTKMKSAKSQGPTAAPSWACFCKNVS